MIIYDYQIMKQDLVDVVSIWHHQIISMAYYQETLRTHSVEALLISHDLWENIPNYLRNKNPIGYPSVWPSIAHHSMIIL
jgi:hypothetical protein